MKFPLKLFDLISSEAHHEIISWHPGGKAFAIRDKKRLAEEILPHYFKSTQFTSFTRKLSRWGFVRIPRGPFLGSYCHEYFQRGNRNLCRQMTCSNDVHRPLSPVMNKDVLVPVAVPVLAPMSDYGMHTQASNAAFSNEFKMASLRQKAEADLINQANMSRGSTPDGMRGLLDGSALSNNSNASMMHLLNRQAQINQHARMSQNAHLGHHGNLTGQQPYQDMMQSRLEVQNLKRELHDLRMLRNAQMELEQKILLQQQISQGNNLMGNLNYMPSSVGSMMGAPSADHQHVMRAASQGLNRNSMAYSKLNESASKDLLTSIQQQGPPNQQSPSGRNNTLSQFRASAA